MDLDSIREAIGEEFLVWTVKNDFEFESVSKWILDKNSSDLNDVNFLLIENFPRDFSGLKNMNEISLFPRVVFISWDFINSENREFISFLKDQFDG